MARGTWKIDVSGVALASYEDVVDPTSADGMPLVQVDALFGATQPVNRDRGNFVLALEFVIYREHPTNAAAVDFFLKGPQTYNGVKDVKFTHIGHDGVETVRWLRGAVVRLRPAKPIGVTNTAALSVTGGKVTDV